MDELRSKLFYEQKNGYDLIDTDERIAVEDYCGQYMSYLNDSRTEREAVKNAIALAEEQGFVNARKPDSQDICFVPDGDYVSFIEKFTGKEPVAGDFVDLDGNVLGRHKGIIGYTVGQRKGLGISLGIPAYVVKKDVAANTVTLGSESDLYTQTLIAEDVNLISVAEIETPMRITAKTRYSQTEQPAVVSALGNGEYLVEFDKPQRAVTSGQAVVFYDGDTVVGGGTIK